MGYARDFLYRVDCVYVSAAVVLFLTPESDVVMHISLLVCEAPQRFSAAHIFVTLRKVLVQSMQRSLTLKK